MQPDELLSSSVLNGALMLWRQLPGAAVTAVCGLLTALLAWLSVRSRRWIRSHFSAQTFKEDCDSLPAGVCAYRDDGQIILKNWAIGVDSFWYKEIQDAPMLDVMDRTMAGEHVFPDAAPEIRLGCAMSSELTARELDVLRELTAGYSNQEIAQRLSMSVNTVRFHLSSMLSKTGFASRTELAIRAAQRGIVAIWQITDET